MSHSTPSRAIAAVQGALPNTNKSLTQNVTGKNSLFADPVNDAITNALGLPSNNLAQQFFEPNNHGGFSDQVGKSNTQPLPATKDPTDPPSVENARLSAFDSLAQTLKRRRDMQTLLTGGQGASGLSA